MDFREELERFKKGRQQPIVLEKQKRKIRRQERDIKIKRAIKDLDPMVRELLTKLGEAQWGRKWLWFANYRIRTDALTWIVEHVIEWPRGNEFGEVYLPGKAEGYRVEVWLDADHNYRPACFIVFVGEREVETQSLSRIELKNLLLESFRANPQRYEIWW